MIQNLAQLLHLPFVHIWRGAFQVSQRGSTHRTNQVDTRAHETQFSTIVNCAVAIPTGTIERISPDKPLAFNSAFIGYLSG